MRVTGVGVTGVTGVKVVLGYEVQQQIPTGNCDEFACRRHGWGARPGGAGRAPLARGPTPPRAKWLRSLNGSLTDE